MQIKESVFLIPGGASGLGSATAQHLVAAGAKVVLADLNAEAGDKFAATLGNPKTLPGTAKMLDRLMPAFWNAWLRQGLLQPPPEERSLAGQWMNAMKSYGSSLESVRADASRGDKEGVNAANALANRRAQEAATLSSQLGMNVCFR